MIKFVKSVIAIGFMGILIACGPNSETLRMVDVTDPEMIEATTQARNTLPKFWSLKDSDNSELSAFSLKVGLPTHDNSLEHIWVDSLEKNGNQITGILINDPVDIPNLNFGDKVTFTSEDITDWQYMKAGKMYGHYTTRVMMKTLPASDVRQLEQLLSENP